MQMPNAICKLLAGKQQPKIYLLVGVHQIECQEPDAIRPQENDVLAGDLLHHLVQVGLFFTLLLEIVFQHLVSCHTVTNVTVTCKPCQAQQLKSSCQGHTRALQ